MKSGTSTDQQKRILFLGNANNPLLINLAIELRKLDSSLVIDMISEAPVSNTEAKTAFHRIVSLPEGKWARSIPGIKTAWMAMQFRTALKKLEGTYDVIHMFYLHVGYTRSKSLLKKLGKKFIVSVFGSELYRSPEIILKQLESLAGMADHVTAANPVTLADFRKRFSIAEAKTSICRFGLRPLDEIRIQRNISKAGHKREAGFTEDSFVITCGYNASPGQQHESIIDSIAQVKQYLPANYLLVFPLGTGDPSRRELLRMKLDVENLRYHFITEYLSDKKLAHLRAATDIMIQVQKTDQLSGAMQEHLYAGSVVITGSWLPYAIFVEAGVKYRTVNAPNEVGKKLCGLIPDYAALAEEAGQNAEKIWELSSWERNAEEWLRLYNA